MNVSEPFIRRPIATSLLGIALFIGGALGYWALPVSARWRPGARPGSSLPVVGVLPWRTRSTSVGGGGLGRLGM